MPPLSADAQLLGLRCACLEGSCRIAERRPRLPEERFEVSTNGWRVACENFRVARLHDGKRQETLNRDERQQDAVREMVEAVRVGRPAPIELEELLAVSRATLRAAESIGSGRSVDLRARADAR